MNGVSFSDETTLTKLGPAVYSEVALLIGVRAVRHVLLMVEDNQYVHH